MLIQAVVLLLVALIILAVGLHLGAHSSIAAGAISLVGSGAFLLFMLLGSTSALSMIAVVIVLGTFVTGAASLFIGVHAFHLAKRLELNSSSLDLWRQTGIALSDLAPIGSVSIAGETWSAEAVGDPIPKGSSIFVVEVDRLHIRVALDPFDSKIQALGG